MRELPDWLLLVLNLPLFALLGLGMFGSFGELRRVAGGVWALVIHPDPGGC